LEAAVVWGCAAAGDSAADATSATAQIQPQR
jgi:hypothetical protein